MVRVAGLPGWLSSLLKLLVIFTVTANSTADDVLDKATAAKPTATTMKWCRDRVGRFPEVVFRVHACAKCLDYLLPDGTGHFRVSTSRGFALLQSVSTRQFVLAEPGNQTAMALVCDTLTSNDCDDWRACCQSAERCCHDQTSSSLTSPASNGSDVGDGDAGGCCPMTWDGFSCVNRTPAGQTAVIACPTFIKRFNSDISGSASRLCWPNSSWYVNDVGLEWTDYNSCHKAQDHKTILTLKLIFKSITLLLLIPSIGIFLVFRPLRSQLRIKLHVNLFLSLALTAVFSLLWEVVVSRDLLVAQHSELFITNHQAACKFLNITSRCLLMTTFFWMFCEGFYLTWLMLQSFRHLSSMLLFCFFGWGIPVLFCLIYTIVRVTSHDDAQCWLTSAGSLEWLIDGPTVACIVMNLLFLVVIMRVMVRQLQSHNDQQSMLRRSLRALLILIPLFGLQQFCIIYRPDPLDPGFYVYEVASAIIINLQGAVVALIFCFFNGEVQGHLKDVYRCLRYKLNGRSQQSRQSVSMTSSIQPRPSRPSLASIDTIASVVLAPIHLTTSASNDGDGGGGGGAGSWRIRVARMEDSIAEQDRESDGDSSMSNGDFTIPREMDAGSEGPPNAKVKDLCLDHGQCPAWAEDSISALPDQTETSADDRLEPENAENLELEEETRTNKKKRFLFFSKSSDKRRKDDCKSAQREQQNMTETGYHSPKQAHSPGCNPAIVIYQDEHDASNYTLAERAAPSAETNRDDVASHAKLYLTLSGAGASGQVHPFVELESLASEEDDSSCKESFCGDDSETLNLVNVRTGDGHADVALLHHDKSSQHMHRRHTGVPHSTCDVNKSLRDGRNKRGRQLTSEDIDSRHLCDARSLQGSDSAVSLASTLPHGPESDGTSMAETEDSGISCVPVQQDVTSQEEAVGPRLTEKLCYVNAAFEHN